MFRMCPPCFEAEVVEEEGPVGGGEREGSLLEESTPLVLAPRMGSLLSPTPPTPPAVEEKEDIFANQNFGIWLLFWRSWRRLLSVAPLGRTGVKKGV